MPRARYLLPCASLLVVGCATEEPAPLSDQARAKIAPAILDALTAGQEQQLLVVIGDATGDTPGPAFAGDDALPPLWPTAKEDVVALADGVMIDDVWDELPIIPVRAPSLDGLAPLLEDPRVLSVSEVRQFATTDAESFPLIGQPTAQAAGKLGTGTAVAVLDTGVEWAAVPFACTAPGTAACKVAVARDFAPEDGARDANGHGSNVAGIVVGVAPGARILALDVFDGGSASSTTILAAYNWVLQNRAAYNVAAINLSLGGGRATATCGTDALAVAFQTGRNAGVVTTVASGNDGYTDSTSWPACAPAAVSVGAVYDANVGGLAYSKCSDPVTAADRVTCFSNSAGFVTVLAPGALIDAAGYRMAGTSQAAPHVAGAAAVLHGAFPAETASQLVTRLVSTGRAVIDQRTGRTTPRIDLARAVGAVTTDRTAPNGSVIINAGAVYAKSRTVTLTLSATDAGGVADMCLGEPCGTWVPYATTATTTLAAGLDGNRTVVVRFRDRAGNVSAPAQDSITLAATAPVITAAITLAASKVTLSWTGADAGSGVASYRLVTALGATIPPAGCTAGSTLASGTTTRYVHGPLAPGAIWSYRICATDKAGNTAPGVAATVTVRA